MSNHLSKSLFSIPRLKKSRSRQQNQPENPTSLFLNALTADDAFLRFAAALGEPFFSSRNPKRNSIIFLCIPLPPRPFSPSKSTKENFIFNPASPVCRDLFHPRKAPKRILFLTLHSQSAAPFSPSKSTKENYIFNSVFPVCRDLFYPRAVPNGILFSHSTSIPPPPRPEAPALHYNIFGLIGRLSPRGAQGLPTCRIHPTIVPEMRCAAPKRRNFPARKRYGRHKSGCRGIRPHKMDTRKEYIHRRGGGYIILGLSAGAGAAGDIIIWKYGTAESARGRY